MQFTGNLAELIATVEKEFSAEMAKSENTSASLSKGEDEKKADKKPSSESKPKEEKAPAAEAKPEAPGAENAPPAEGAAPAPAEGAAPAPAAAVPGAVDPAAAAGHGYDEEDMAHMREMYASMSQDELMAHHDAIRDALDACSAAPAAPGAAAPQPPAAPAQDPMMGKSEGNKKGHSELSQENPELNSKPKAGGKDMNNDPKNGGIEAAPPHNPVGARSEASKDSKNLKDAMTKTERERRNGGKIEASPVRNSPGAKSPASTDQGNLKDMEKSENIGNDLQKSLEAAEAKNAELKKSLDTVQEFLTKLVTKVSAPKGKAVTEIASLAKNEDGSSSVDTNSMSKSEITQKLLQKSSDPRTSAQDRAAINAYYLSNANVNTISHLLK
jgi:hypothetical protein